MATLRDLQLKFWANVAEITSDLNKIERQVEKFSRNVDKLGKAAAAGLAAIGGAAVFGKMVEGAKEAEAAMAQVEAAIRSTSGAAGMTAKEIGNLSNEIKRMTGIDDDLVNSMSSVLLTFTKVGKETFPQATRAIVDMSTRMGIDMKSAAIQVGKALNDPIQGISALQRVGVSFTDSQKNMIKKLVETGESAKAQAMILQELQREFGGSAAAARDTLGGALTALKQNIDDAIDSFNGANGLREAVEFANVVLEDFADVMKGAQEPTSEAQKQIQAFGKILSDSAYTARVWANTVIYGVQLVWNGLSEFGKGAAKVAEIFKPFTGAMLAMNPMAAMTVNAFKNLGKAVGDNDAIIRKALKSGAMPDYFAYFDNAAERAKKKMEDLHAAAAGAKGPRVSGGEEGLSKAQEKALKAAEKAAEKAAKHQQQLHDNEKKSIEGVLQAFKQKNVDLEQSLVKHKEIADQLEAEHKISGMTNVSLKERLQAIAEIGKLTRERQEIERKIAVGEERKKLSEVLQNIKQQTEQLQVRNKHQEELLPILEAEKAIRDAVKVGLGENLDLQKQITEAAQAQAAAIKEQKHQESLKALKDMSKEYDDQLSKLDAKLRGQEDMLPLLEQEKKIREDINLTEDEKNTAIASNRQKFEQVGQLNQALDDQKRVLENIKSSASDYNDKLKQLGAAFNSGQINAKQFNDVALDLWETQKKSKTVADEFASTLVGGLSKAFTSAKNLRDGLKDAAKQLALFAAQHLLLKPLENAIANLGNWLTGSGKYTKNPMGQSPSIAGSGVGSGIGGLLPALGLAGAPAAGGGFWSGLKNVAGSGLTLFRKLIPGFAQGGTAPGGQMAMFGEDGPELAIPKADLHVFTSGQTRSMLNQMSGGASERLFGNHALNTGGSAFTHGVSAVGGSLFNSLSGGGSITPEEYLGDWVPQHRRELLSSIGFSSAGSRVLSLMKAIRESKNNYHTQALNAELTNALHFREQEWQGLLGEYRELAAAANRAGAQKVVDEETAAGRGEGLAAMANNAILSNNHISHGIIAQGRLVAPRGNAVEDALAAGKLIGKMPSEALLKHLASLDAEASADYMPGNFIRPSSNYKSMSEAGQYGGAKVFGVDDAYGGDGRQAAIGDMLNTLRDERWANDAQNSYWKSINNRNPLGSYQGASAEYLANVKGWNKFPKNYLGPGANSSYSGSSDYPGEGFALSNAGYVPTGATGDTNGWIDGDWTGSPNPSRFDPTVVSKDYVPKMGNLKGWSDEVKNKEYLNKGGFRDMVGGLLSNLKKIGKSALKPFGGLNDSWQIPGKGLKTGGLMKDMLSSFNSWADGKGDFALNMGGLRGDLKSSASSWAYKGKGLKTGGLVGDLKDSLGSWLPKPAPYNGLFGTGPLFGDGDLKGLAAYSGPMLTPAMGIAMPPSMRLVHGRPPSAPQPFRGNLSPYADLGYRDLFVNQHRDRYSTVGNSAFGRYQTDPFTAGRINAKMRGFASGGIMKAGELAVVGERGKEFVMSPHDAQIVPAAGFKGGKPELKVVVNNLPGQTSDVQYQPDGSVAITTLAKAVGAELESFNYPGTNIPRKRRPQH